MRENAVSNSKCQNSCYVNNVDRSRSTMNVLRTMGILMYLSTGNWATPISRDVVKRSRKAIEWTLPWDCFLNVPLLACESRILLSIGLSWIHFQITGMQEWWSKAITQHSNAEINLNTDIIITNHKGSDCNYCRCRHRRWPVLALNRR